MHDYRQRRPDMGKTSSHAKQAPREKRLLSIRKKPKGKQQICPVFLQKRKPASEVKNLEEICIARGKWGYSILYEDVYP